MGPQGADGDIFPGDTIQVEISAIAALRNSVVAVASGGAVSAVTGLACRWWLCGCVILR